LAEPKTTDPRINKGGDGTSTNLTINDILMVEDKPAPWFFPFEVKAPRGIKGTFLLFVYSFQVYSILNVTHLIFYPLTFIYKMLLLSASQSINLDIYNWIYWLMYCNPIISIISKFFFHLFILALVIPLSIGKLGAILTEKMYNLEVSSEALMEPR
jgi:hypothetical protein